MKTIDFTLSNNLNVLIFIFLLAMQETCRVLVPRPGMEPGSRAEDLNQWITREVPYICI